MNFTLVEGHKIKLNKTLFLLVKMFSGHDIGR